MTIGFVGQGYVGKNAADDFENRGHSVVRFALEAPYNANKDRIKECGIVFIAVPTPTTPDGFDSSIVESVFSLMAPHTIVVIKSTLLPGTSGALQKAHPEHIVLFAPEFLSEATAAEDSAHPFVSIVGMTISDDAHRKAAEEVLALLPAAPFSLICTSAEAEIIKYTHNASGYVQIVYFNLMYELAKQFGANWDVIASALRADPFIPNRYSDPVHKAGRGAGGSCFIKDFAALRDLYEKVMDDTKGAEVFRALEAKNIELLKATNKDLGLLSGVYGK
jgi:UDPglucose 6-dehydrogenase